MTRNSYRVNVCGTCVRHCSDRSRRTDRLSNLLIGPQFPPRNGFEVCPNASLKRGWRKAGWGSPWGSFEGGHVAGRKSTTDSSDSSRGRALRGSGAHRPDRKESATLVSATRRAGMPLRGMTTSNTVSPSFDRTHISRPKRPAVKLGSIRRVTRSRI